MSRNSAYGCNGVYNKVSIYLSIYHNLANLTLTPSTGCTETYVRLTWTGRKLVLLCKPLTWLVYRTSTFLIRKNKETVENCLQITLELKFVLKLVITANLILNKIRLNIPFNLATPRSFYLFLRAPF